DAADLLETEAGAERRARVFLDREMEGDRRVARSGRDLDDAADDAGRAIQQCEVAARVDHDGARRLAILELHTHSVRARRVGAQDVARAELQEPELRL